MSFTSSYTNESFLNLKLKWQFRTSASKKRKNGWKKKGYWAALKAFSLGKSLSTGNSKSFFVQQTNKK